MENLWGEEIEPQEEKRKSLTHPPLTAAPLTAQDCHFYGHTWTKAGLSQERLCLVCGIKGYCPVCTPLHIANDAEAFICTKHSQGRVQA